MPFRMPTIFTDAGALSPNEDVPLGAVAVTHVPQWKNKAGTRESEGVQRLGIISGNTPFSLKHVCVYRYIYIHIYMRMMMLMLMMLMRALYFLKLSPKPPASQAPGPPEP